MEKTPSFIWVQTPVYKKKVLISSILYCKAVNRKVDIYFHPEGKLEGTYHTLTEMESMLSAANFCRCNRQYILNLDHVEQYSDKIPEVILSNGERVSISRERKETIDRMLMVS